MAERRGSVVGGLLRATEPGVRPSSEERKKMRKLVRGLMPSPALVVACMALFVAMGGIGYAAVKLKPASVKTKTIKDGAVTESKLAANAVSNGKVQDNAITGQKV